MSTDPLSSSDLMARGQALLNANDFAGALPLLDQALAATPSWGLAHFERARALQGLGRCEEAIHGYTECLRLSPEEFVAYRNRGLCRRSLADHDGAAEDFQRYVGLRPDRSDVWLDLGDRLLDAGKFTPAVEAYGKAVMADPKLAERTTPWIAKVRALERTRTEGPPREHAAACRERGWAKFQDGAYRTATLWFNRALDAVADDADALHGRGLARRSLGDVGGSSEDLRKAMALDPTLRAKLTPLLQPTATAAAPAAAASPAAATSPAPIAPPTPPPPAAAPAPPRPVPSWSAQEILIGLAVLGVLILVTAFRIPYLSGIPARAADIPYKAGWIIAHWYDAEKFPPKSDLCMEPFCTRTDVEKKHVCGRPGYTSEISARYCPDHEPGWIRSDTRFDSVILVGYWLVSLILTFFLIAAGTVLVIYVVLLPLLLVQVLSGKKPSATLSPFHPLAVFWAGEAAPIIPTIISIVCAVMLLMYMFW